MLMFWKDILQVVPLNFNAEFVHLRHRNVVRQISTQLLAACQYICIV